MLWQVLRLDMSGLPETSFVHWETNWQESLVRFFSSNMRVRIRQPGEPGCYYYPDAVVDCSGLPNTAIYSEEPAVIFEVISAETERIDVGEKQTHYRTLPSLRVYVLVNQFNPAVTIYQRVGAGWQIEFLGRMDLVLELPEIECRLPLATMYERMGFA